MAKSAGSFVIFGVKYGFLLQVTHGRWLALKLTRFTPVLISLTQAFKLILPTKLWKLKPCSESIYFYMLEKLWKLKESIYFYMLEIVGSQANTIYASFDSITLPFRQILPIELWTLRLSSESTADPQLWEGYFIHYSYFCYNLSNL